MSDVSSNSKSQRGAALLTVLLVSMLLLATGGALVLTTALATRTAIDSTSELQAYYSAEAGLEESLNVLRGNIAPNAGMPGGSKINFRDAVTPSTSNLPTDTGTDPRLSGWLNYGYTPAGSTNPDRIPLTATAPRRKGVTIKLSRRMKHVYPRTIALVEHGLVDLEQIISHRYPLARTAEAFEYLTKPDTDALKIVVEP